MLLLMVVGVGEMWAYTGNAVVKMTYVDYDNPNTSYGEITTGETAKAGYNKITSKDGYPYVEFGNTGWGCNWITYIEVDASAIPGNITNVTLTADISGPTDNGTRDTEWSVGYNFETWRSDWTFNTADRHFIQLEGTQRNTSRNRDTFVSATFDITNALKEDADRKVNLVVYETAAAGGYIKNPVVTVTYEIGWTMSSFTADLTSVDQQNKLSGMPTFYNPDNVAVTYTYPDMVGVGWSNTSYPPRLKSIGSGTVTASVNVGGTTYNYDYTLNVTGTTVTGTYDDVTNKYTFDQIGIIEQRTFADVRGITMEIASGPTALVVQAGSYTALKMIDEGGYSQPNLTGGVIPPSGNRGGTYYKFTTLTGGILYLEGNCEGASLYKSDGTAVMTGFWSTKTFHLDEGTYYLYNPGSAEYGAVTPLLHSYRFEPDVNAGLKFKNPSSTITVDLSEGSYTNEAISGLGLPVTYSIVTGGDYATINATTGKVTFKKAELLDRTFPLTITVMAHTDAWGTYAASSATYNLQLAKTSWIFNDNDLWTTNGSDLSSPWGGRTNYAHHNGDGTYHYQITNKTLNNEPLTIDGTTLLPETKGLLFSTDNAKDRLEIAPHGESPNYIAGVNTTIYVPDVAVGQTVTVDWYATKGYATISMTDAGGNGTGDVRQGVISLTATTAGTVQISTSGNNSYIRSIKVSTPVRATGTLTYGKTLLNADETVNRTGYTITDEETGADIKDAYHGPGTYKSSNTDVVTVDGSGNITAVAPGFAFITATASPINSATHQTATLMTLIEVTELASGSTRIRDININKLLYEVGTQGISANNSNLDRTVPGFTLTFSGGQGVKCNSVEKLIMRNQGDYGTLEISPRAKDGANVTIAKVILSTSSLGNSPKVTVNGGSEQDVTNGITELSGIYATSATIHLTQGEFQFSDIKIYYQCPSDVDNCLDETKVAPTFNFPANKQHFMRVPGDGRAFQNDTPTSSDPKNFRAETFTYSSNNTNIATIGRDGTNGLLINSGEATITATFAETDYFAESTVTYTVSNTLLPGESYNDVAMSNGQFIHVTAEATAANTTLTMENAANNITFGTERERNNTYVTSDASVNLKNETSESITIYSIDIVTSNIVAWVYYEGQEENFTRQIQFAGFETGNVEGFKVMDMGDMNNIIDLTDAYDWKAGTTFAIQDMENGVLVDGDGHTQWNGDGSFSTGAYGDNEHAKQIRRTLTKNSGMAAGYPDEIKAVSNVTIMQFDADHPVVWDFQNQLDNTGVSGEMGSQWTYTNPGTGREKFYGAAFMDGYMPILKSEEPATDPSQWVKDNNVGVLVKGEMRYYAGTSGLRLNLTMANAHIKFPVKEGMEVKITVATSSADVTNTISNAKSVTLPNEVTTTLYVQREGVNSPINAYYLAASDGCMILDAGDKVGVYIKSITLQVPELHFTEEVVTELTGTGGSIVNYKPYNAVEGHTLNYWVKDGHNHDLNDGWLSTGDVATITDGSSTEPGHSGDVSLTGTEGWVTIYVEDPFATGVQPRKGEYKLYAVNFRFANDSYSITLDGSTGEAYFTERPIGYDKVKTPIEYTMTLGAGNPRGRIIQYTNENPALTTYTMTAYSTGTITVTATSGNATTSCEVTVGGLSFQYVAPALSENDLKSSNNTFTNPWPTGWSDSDDYTFEVSRSAYDDAVSCNEPEKENGLKLTGLSGHGAIRVVANNTTKNQTARFVLTLSYPASSRKKWAFFRAKDHNDDWGLEIGTIGTYVSYNDVGTSATGIAKSVDGYNGKNGTDTWTTQSTWTEIFRKGAELPRWGNDRSMKGDNAFYVQETAGLQIETGNKGFYVDQPARVPTETPYNHIGLHNNASITIPKLKEGDYISLNLSRVIPNNGAIMKGHNVTDLRGKDVTEEFTITRSQTEYPDPTDKTKMATNDDGSRFIPGYYTFIAHDLREADDPDKIANPGEFDVTFELVDEGYLDVLSVEIYDGGFYKHTMTEIKLKDQSELAPNLMLKEEDETQEVHLEFCHPLWSTSTGPAEYVFKGEQENVAETYTQTEARYWVDETKTQKLKDDRKNLNMSLSHVKWFSAGGVEYEDGLITVNSGYGKVVLRMNNYTVEGRYLIGYTPDYVLNVGVIPHQDYPHTWNFTNISGGEVKGEEKNVYNSIKADGSNWIHLGGADQVYELNTDYRGASLYVPGGELVSTDRILGQRGETPSDYPARGYDELNGLGVAGKVMFPLSPVEATTTPARQQAPSRKRAPEDHILLSYYVESKDIAVRQDLDAGNGKINFGSSSDKFEASSVSSTGYAYKCDGGDSKYVLLKPSRALRPGDVISIKAYSPNENSGLAFWTEATNTTGTKNITSLHLTQKNVEETLEYTVTSGDGIDGLTYLYVYNSGTTSYFVGVTITESYKPDDMGYNLYAVTETTLTIPDLNADGKQDWIYISADQKPTSVTNATEVYEDSDTDGPDANPLPDASNTANKVWKYKATNPGSAYATFPVGTNIYQIGVTHILKEIHPVGGTGWATESRDHSIDHTLTGYFTQNDVDAFKVNFDSYDMETATVALTPVEESKGVPANTGMVLRELDAANLPKANSGNMVPLFYPAVSTPLVDGMEFSTTGNMMYPNVTEARHYMEETGDNTKFILTNVHWRYSVESSWSKSDGNYIENRDGEWKSYGAHTDDVEAAGFYRLHIQGNASDDTMPANTAYLLVPSDKLPVALWNTVSASGSRVYDNSLGIREIGDVTNGIDDLRLDPTADADGTDLDAGDWYSIDGQKLQKRPTRNGLYIYNGRKVVVKQNDGLH